MTPLRLQTSVLTAAAVLFLAPFARALVAPTPPPADSGCATNAECGRGYECTVVGGTGCASSTCPDGVKCPPPEPCTPTEIRECTPAHCEVDADCADGMVCHEWTSAADASSCACDPNLPCDCGPAPPPTTVKLCTARYLLPCSTASDCGEGFKCEEAQSCGCSGGTADPASTPSSGSGATPVPPDAGGGSDSGGAAPPPTCTCEPSGQFQCVIEAVTCQADTQCPVGWTCAQPIAVSAPTCAPGAACATPEPQPTSGYCQPPYYGGATPGAESPKTPEGNSNSGSTGSGTPVGTPGPAPTAEGAPASDAAGDDDAQAHESSACNFGRAAGTRSAFGLALVLGAFASLRRRRAQR